ncbi:MAG: zinc-ribbon domain containing protein [Chloroflexi bacterium]|uniref:Zinc-ribbon domain containing protein n=1 Tax=Candidatus Chlorohelix allophototropha TaxID=3003348 RepID=A0A8T7LZQ4_9CHLR|nr:zinc-ribbon domain containing protein [Chloroflexota bacterium]WJW66949.1 zinc-ribbon domain containing protein [Chloroflexota bacterium L227-S17]
MEFEDISLICKDCGTNFLFTAGEQDFYQQKGLVNQPGRCHECRTNRRTAAALNSIQVPVPTQPEIAQEQPTESTTPAVITSTVKETTKINCAACGKDTTVPFRPRLSRPVYCYKCYNEMRANTTIPPSELAPAEKNQDEKHEESNKESEQVL